MSLLAESLVEEWLNRAGFFTVRGARSGVSEMDLLAVRQGASGLEGRHVEVHVSTNPISYLTSLTKDQAVRLGKAKTSAWERPREILEEAVSAWVEKKFSSRAKAKARDQAWPGLSWSFEFIHGAVRHAEELELIRAKGIRTTPFHDVLASLCNDPALAQKGGAGSDIAEMIAYYVKVRGTGA
jgi:hypothetical protein